MSEFTWEDSIDENIDKHGVVFLYGVGAQQAIQQFCEDLSNLIGYKCDWAYAAGRFRMKVLPEGLDAVRVALENKTWFQRYVKPLSPEDVENGSTNLHSYFEPYMLPCVQSFPEDAEEALTKEETDYKLEEREVTTTDSNGNTITQVIVHRVGI